MKKVIILCIALMELSHADWMYNEDYDKCVRTPSYYHGIEASREEVSKFPECRHEIILKHVYPEVSLQEENIKNAAMMIGSGSGSRYPSWMRNSMYECNVKNGKIYFYFFGLKEHCESLRSAMKNTK